MQINFKHTKTDVAGLQKRAKRNLYPNVIEPEIDFTFLLGLYLACGFTTSSRQEAGFRLFPGSSEGTAKRVSRILKEVLESHKEDVLSMGYTSISDIGLHSLRKGAATYLGSLPGGPSPVAICHRCGWSTGKVLDIYFQQLQRGDEFVGRCLSLLNLMSSDFALSPAYFHAESVDAGWLSNCLEKVFPCFYRIDSLNRILQQCLASMLHHRDYVAQLEPNHPAKTSIAIFRDPDLMEQGLAALKVDKAWDTTNHISGVPPHVKELVDLAEIKDQLEAIVNQIFEKVMQGTTDYFESRRIGGGEITEARLMELIQNASDATRTEVSERITNQLERLMHSLQPNQVGRLNGESEEADQLQTNELPHDFEFPSSNALDLWIQWQSPNRARNIPALKNVPAECYKFLDHQPRSTGERNRLTRVQRTRPERRVSRKAASDMKVLCEFIENEAKKFGYSTITEENMREAFRAVTLEWESASVRRATPGGRVVRIEHQSWKTTLKFVRELKKARATANGVDSTSETGGTVANIRRRGRRARRTQQSASSESASEAVGAATNIMRGSRRARHAAASSAEGSATDSTTVSLPRRPRRRQRTQRDTRNPTHDIDLADHFPDAFDGLSAAQMQQIQYVDPQEVQRIRAAEQQAVDQEMLDNNHLVVRRPHGVAQNYGQNSLIERQQYANVLESQIQNTAPAVPRHRMGRNGRPIGRCCIVGCCFPTMELYTCHLDGCNQYVHHLCADGSELASNQDERYKYCSSEHKEIGG